MSQQKYKDILVGLIITGITVTIILSGLILGEIYVRNQAGKELGGDIENNPFPIRIGFYTHDEKKFTDIRNPHLKFITDPFTMYKNYPNQKIGFWNINSLGFRGHEIQPEKKGKKRIIIAGGSEVFGSTIGNDDYTFPAYLENIDHDYEVINAGVVCFLSGQELTYIVTELVDYQPDIIIVFDGWNDLESQWCHEAQTGRKKGKKELGYNSVLYMQQIEKNLISNFQNSRNIFYYFKYLMDKSFLFKKIKSKFGNLLSSAKKINIYERDKIINDRFDNKYFNDIISNYTNNLIKMNNFCNSNNICLFVIFQPELGNKTYKTASENYAFGEYGFNYSDVFPPLYKSFIDASEKILQKNNVNYLDMNSFPEFMNCKERLFSDVVHTNRKGNQLIAQIIDHYLKTVISEKCKK